MSFTVLLHPKAAKELEKIESATKTRIVERLRDLKDNPERVGKALKHSNFWSLRVGDYRAIYEINIHDWVTSGGALIVIPDAGYPPTLNTIMALYGI